MRTDFYIYCLFRPWNGEPFYIGKGHGRRYTNHAWLGKRHYNKHVSAIFTKAEKRGLEVPVVLLHEGLTEALAFEYEVALIATIGRSDLGRGPLANLTDGGEGVAGVIWTEERRKEHGIVQKATWTEEKRAAKGAYMSQLWQDDAYRRGQSERNLGNTHAAGTVLSEEARAKKSEQLLGNQHALGYKWTPELHAYMTAVRNEPAAVESARKRITDLWKNPEWRAQQMASRSASEAYQNRHKNRKPPPPKNQGAL